MWESDKIEDVISGYVRISRPKAATPSEAEGRSEDYPKRATTSTDLNVVKCSVQGTNGFHPGAQQPPPTSM